MRALIVLFQKRILLGDVELLIVIVITYVLLSKYFSASHIVKAFNVNFLRDIDLTVSTDFEDLLIIASDVFEVMEHDRLLAMDGIADLFLARGFLSFSANTSSTIR